MYKKSFFLTQKDENYQTHKVILEFDFFFIFYLKIFLIKGPFERSFIERKMKNLI